MAVNPIDLGARSYDKSMAFRAAVGATALKEGDLVKFTANLLVPCVATDDTFSTPIFVVLESCAANGASVTLDTLVVPVQHAVMELAYTTTPTLGTSYGLNDARTVKTSDTTDKCVTVVKIDTSRTTCWCIAYTPAS